MKDALKKQANLILAGCAATLISAAAVYGLDRSRVDDQRREMAQEQAERITTLLTAEYSELDAATAYLAQSETALGQFSSFVSRLRISDAGDTRWLIAARSDRARATALQAWVRTTLKQPDFAIPASANSQTSTVILSLDGEHAASLGTDLAAGSRTLAAATGAPLEIMRLAPAFGGKDVLWLSTKVPPWTDRHHLFFDGLVLVRGLDLAMLSRFAALKDQPLDMTLSTGSTPGQALLQSADMSSLAPALSQDLSLDGYAIHLRIGLTPHYTVPRNWLAVMVAGLALTGLLAAWRAGFILSNRATSLLSALANTRSELSATNRKESAFFDNAGIANCEVDAGTARFTRVNDACCALFGYERAELLAKTVYDVTHQGDLKSTESLVGAASWETGKLLQFEKRYIRSDGTLIWGLVSSKIFESGGSPPQRIFLTTIIDITARKQDEIIRNNLLRELAHRVRNTMQLAASLARQSGRNAGSVADYDEKFTRRLAALNATQDLLLDSSWRSADLHHIAQRTLLPYMSGNVEVSLPSVALPTQHAQTFALAVHELAANATRHGALRYGGALSFHGKIEVDPQDGCEKIHLFWVEKVNRRHRGHARAGFGRTILDEALPEQFSGRASTSMSPAGLMYEAWLRIPQIEEQAFGNASSAGNS